MTEIVIRPSPVSFQDSLHVGLPSKVSYLSWIIPHIEELFWIGSLRASYEFVALRADHYCRFSEIFRVRIEFSCHVFAATQSRLFDIGTKARPGDLIRTWDTRVVTA